MVSETHLNIVPQSNKQEYEIANKTTPVLRALLRQATGHP